MKPGVDFVGVGCGAFILNEKNEMLLLRRTKNSRNEAGTWAIPGGKIDFNEMAEQAITREMKEELDIDIQVEKFITYIDHILPHEKQHWVSLVFKCKIVNGVVNNLEPHKNDRVEWFALGNLPKEKAVIFKLLLKKLKLLGIV